MLRLAGGGALGRIQISCAPELRRPDDARVSEEKELETAPQNP